MNLDELARELPVIRRWGTGEGEIVRLTQHSEEVEPGMVFFAIRGGRVDGHRFIDDALEQGAIGIVAENAPTTVEPIFWVKVENSREALGLAASAWHGHPSHDLGVCGVTGTNGKTTTAFLLHHLLESGLMRAGLIGTIRYVIGDEARESRQTTPDALVIEGLLAEMREAGCRAVSMEVSSHALDQSRLAGVEFDVGIFTNLTQDHLDYHGDLEAYFEAKCRLGEQMIRQSVKKRPVLVINGDDPFGERMVRRFSERLKVVTYGFRVANEYRAADVKFDRSGTTFELQMKGRSLRVRTPLIGRFNVYNTLGALAAAGALKLNLREAARHLEHAPQVPGRLERIEERQSFHVFVDYAHTPDALENVLETIGELRPARLICVFGCGGNRDRNKRRLMGQAVDRASTWAVVTSDNPRGEEPEAIIRDIEQGFGTSKYEVEPDREKAITRAIRLARKGDVVLIAGKGHETTQEFADRTIEFNDRLVARRALRDRRDEEVQAQREAERSEMGERREDGRDREGYRDRDRDWERGDGRRGGGR